MTAVIHQLPQNRRVMREPTHTWNLQHKPYVIQPFLLAPVVPGETMKNMTLASRCVTDPVQSPLIGWWLEYFVFYVKHRDLEEREEFTNMMLDPSWSPSAVDDDTADRNYYHQATVGGEQINYAKLCQKVVIEHYFRNEGETWDQYMLGGMPLASINRDSWIDSAIRDTDYATYDVNTDLNADTNIMASEIEQAMQQYNMLRAHGMTDQTYEQYLQTHGVRVAPEEIHKPELVRYIKDWKYPSNTISPTDGSPSSAVSWSIAERADKDRYFKEPGFLFGVTVARPKVYLRFQAGSAAHLMNDAYAWLPAVMAGDSSSSMRKLAQGVGPLNAVTDDYWIDIRDLFIYGDQFINHSDYDNNNFVQLPHTDLQRRYIISSAEQYKFFVDSTNASGKTNIHQDGIANLKILGKQVDTTPAVNPGTV